MAIVIMVVVVVIMVSLVVIMMSMVLVDVVVVVVVAAGCALLCPLSPSVFLYAWVQVSVKFDGDSLHDSAYLFEMLLFAVEVRIMRARICWAVRVAHTH